MYFLVQAQIPTADTTYWCAAYELPQEVQQQERYIIRVSTSCKIHTVHSQIRQLFSWIAQYIVHQSKFG